MVLRSERLSLRSWTFHDDELADDWPSYNDPLEPLWNLPRQVGLAGDVWSFFESSAMRRTWAVEDRSGHLIGRISLRDIDTRKSQARLGITFGAPYIGRGLGTEALALFLTGFVMGPVLQKAYDDGIKPLVANQITVEQAFERGTVPLRAFMQKNVREKDLKLFMDLSGEPPAASPEQMSLRILIPAFMISELKRAFEIGFLLFLPFLIIDLVVASVLMSMGMMMLPPVVVSLPFKLIFFVLVDGWSLVAGSLVQSYGGG